MTETPLNTYRSHEQRSNDTSRRTILKGAAWSVPVLTIATAAPAAASGLCEGAFTFLPNPIVLNPYDATGYWTPITITHSGPAPIAVVNVVVTGANISLTTGGTTGTVTLSGGTGLVNIVTKPGAAGGTLSISIADQDPACPATTVPITVFRGPLSVESNFGIGGRSLGNHEHPDRILLPTERHRVRERPDSHHHTLRPGQRHRPAVHGTDNECRQHERRGFECTAPIVTPHKGRFAKDFAARSGSVAVTL